MRRGYERERKGGPSLEDQRKAMGAAGINLLETHPAVYTDTLAPSKKPPLYLRSLAIRSLRPGDELVVYDGATLGTDAEDIAEALASITRAGCSLVVCFPEERSYTWHKDAADMLQMAAEAVRVLRSEKHRRAGAKSLNLGAPLKLTGEVLTAAKAAWAEPELTARQAAKRVGDVTGVEVSMRLLFSKLGKKSDAEGKLP